AAYFLASRGVNVTLHEMRPTRTTEAHKTGGFAELVCSNSLKSLDPLSAPGMLKTEMRAMGSLILRAAQSSAVPGGQALSVDRDRFSRFVTEAIESHPHIEIDNCEMSAPPIDAPVIIATGPLTAAPLHQWLSAATGS